MSRTRGASAAKRRPVQQGDKCGPGRRDRFHFFLRPRASFCDARPCPVFLSPSPPAKTGRGRGEGPTEEGLRRTKGIASAPASRERRRLFVSPLASASKPHAILIRHPLKPRIIPPPLDNDTMTFIRFTVPSDEVRIDTHVAAGLFHATYRLAREGRFEEGERLWFRGGDGVVQPVPACHARPADLARRLLVPRRRGRSHLAHLAPRRHRRRRRRPGARLPHAPPGQIVYANASRSLPFRGATRSRRDRMLAKQVTTRDDPDIVAVAHAGAPAVASFSDPVAATGRTRRTGTAGMWPRPLRPP